MAEALLLEVGKGLAIEGAKGLAQLIMSRASEEVRLAMGFRDELDKLRRKLEYVEALLEDLGRSNRQVQQMRLLETWIKRFEDVTYLTDNLMDEYAYEIIRRKLELKYPDSGVTKFRNCFACTPLFFWFRMSLKVRNILKLFDELDVEAKAIGLKQVDMARDVVRETYAGNIIYGNCRSWNQAREHVSRGGDSNGFVGRKEDERKLLEMLCDSCNEDTSLPVVGIVGMGGIIYYSLRPGHLLSFGFGTKIKKRGDIQLVDDKWTKLYMNDQICLKLIQSQVATNSIVKSSSLQLWHRSLGHPSKKE